MTYSDQLVIADGGLDFLSPILMACQANSSQRCTFSWWASVERIKLRFLRRVGSLAEPQLQQLKRQANPWSSKALLPTLFGYSNI
jgi:hypothetical protein